MENVITSSQMIFVIILIVIVFAVNRFFTLQKMRQMKNAIADLKQDLGAVEMRMGEMEGHFLATQTGQKEILKLLMELGRSGKNVKKSEFDNVAAEVRVLQRIVEQLAQSRGVGGGMTTVIRERATEDIAAKKLAPVIRTDYDSDRIMQIIETALRTDSVDLYIQPIVSLPQRKRRHFECFSRLSDSEGGIILPDQYLPVAEAAGLITGIDNLLLFRCIQLIRRAKNHNVDGSFFCNISKHTFNDLNFFADFLEFLRENEELPERLVFEMTQQDFAERTPSREALLKQLHEVGCHLALSNVTDLRFDVEELDKYRFKYVKVEIGTLLPAIKGTPPFDLQIFRRSLSSYNMDLIVERIEDEDTLLQLLEYNLDYGQGYLFGEPKLSKG
jgi:cyclic-di-GMP phosphodiesterase TipF (flagellum assembly factor)